MRKVLGCLGLLIVAGCVGGGTVSGGMVNTAMQVADQPLPPEVSAAIPADLALHDVLVLDGCYYYQTGGQIYPVVTMFMRDNGMGDQPFCVG